ncbi:ubiquitin recognition factor in ER-associated degradation protein 1-like isoform X2 [Aphis craccivora]|uniref:Ubiquitin recognition factor in ER-associated degradation protein 1-like isoform X2 n=1 Tax=Aphis craccivora TaxID=307492 RepID=A0A6G0ZKF2_APHCR|nr:ubiquitin recognition factor in ER-associated degradation protein 1-like isoform X2 [Aphis craccivora]
MTYSDHSTHYTDVGQFQCFQAVNEKMLNVVEKVSVIMPPSALDTLTRLNINYPMLFKLTNKRSNRQTHCGVLEFIADEDKIYIPYWMMKNLLLDEGDMVQVESVSLEVATFSKFQPQNSEFLDITNPKAVLENCLRNFACLTTGDVIAIKYNQKIYEMCVLETKPGNAVSIIECDMNVEFAAPVGYQEPNHEKKTATEDMMVDPADLMPEPTGFIAFKGSGNRLDGKKKKENTDDPLNQIKPAYQRGIPDYNYTLGTIQFLRNIRPVINDKENENQDEFKPFAGSGSVLKTKAKKK